MISAFAVWQDDNTSRADTPIWPVLWLLALKRRRRLRGHFLAAALIIVQLSQSQSPPTTLLPLIVSPTPLKRLLPQLFAVVDGCEGNNVVITDVLAVSSRQHLSLLLLLLLVVVMLASVPLITNADESKWQWRRG